MVEQFSHVLRSSVLITSQSALIQAHMIQFQQVRSSMIGSGFNILMTSLGGEGGSLSLQNEDSEGHMWPTLPDTFMYVKVVHLTN